MSNENILGVGSRVKHPAYGDGVVIGIRQVAYQICFIQYGIKVVGKDYDGMEIVEQIPSEEGVTFSKAEKALVAILRKWSDVTEIVPLGARWKDGTMILKPADPEQKPKEIPIETFFHKIVMVRDRLRVMEQRVNSSKNLSDEEKVNLQQYITRIYGSLTTFNILFKHKSESFVGEKK